MVLPPFDSSLCRGLLAPLGRALPAMALLATAKYFKERKLAQKDRGP